MATRRPVVFLNGTWQQLPAGDTIVPDALPSTGDSGANYDGGTPSSSYTGAAKIDFGGVT